MRKLVNTILALAISVLLIAPDVSARGREHRNGNNSRPRTENSNRPGGNRRSDKANHRPGNNSRPDRPNGNHRPGNNGRPDRPNNSYRPPRPPKHHHHRPPYVAHRPHRPYMPVNRPWRPPMPPRGYRCHPGAPRFSAILGVTLGSALDLSLNVLLNGGYVVNSYGPSTIYLTSVPFFNVTWPNVTFNYIDGAFRGSEFTYSTAYYDLGRYNMMYNDLVRRYGNPVSYNNSGMNLSATWWGYDNGYITLNFFRDYAYNGSVRYYTNLLVGN